MEYSTFTQDQQDQLRSSPYVERITSKSVSFTENFKELFYRALEDGKKPREIFKEYGIDPNLLGRTRISGFTRYVRKQAKRPEGFKNLNQDRDRFGTNKERSEKEELKYLRHKVAYLEQENEFLKKNDWIVKGRKWEEI